MKKILAVILAFLCLATPLSVLAADVYEVAEKHTYTNGTTTIPYRLLLPDDYDTNGNYPMLLFLHGAGERGNDNELQFFNCIQTIYDTMPEDCIILVPQCPLNQQWVDVAFATGPYSTDSVPESNELQAVVEIVNEVTESYAVDTDRIYAAGLSMGGYGTWDLMVRHNDIFAAAIAVCGGADASKADLLKHTPLFVFHGDVDETVPVSGSRNVVNAIKAAGGTLVEYTEFTGWGHGVWNKTFQTEGLLAKLLACRLSDRYPASSDPDISGTLEGGKTNVALGATATVSGLEVNDGRFTADLAVDGDGSTRVSFANDVDKQWLLLDLKDTYTISSFEIAFKEHVSEYEIQVSTNGTDFTTVYNVTGGTEGNSITDKINMSTPVTARYIKYIQHKRWYYAAWNKYYSGGIYEFCAFTINNTEIAKYNDIIEEAEAFLDITSAKDARYGRVLRYSDQLRAYLKTATPQLAKAEGLYEAIETTMNAEPEIIVSDNLVFGNAYTTSIAAHADYADDSGRDLTDGVVITHEDNQTSSPYNDRRWVGFNVGTARKLDVIVPLGDGNTVYDLGKVVVNIGGDKLSAGVTEPDVTVYYTEDGETYKEFGKYTRTGEDKYAFSVVIEPEKSVKATAIKVTASLENMTGKNLIWLGEIEAYAGEPAEVEPEYITGDVNNDGSIDSADYLIVKRACFGSYLLSEEEAMRANVDGSATVDSVDYVLVKRIAFGSFTA